MVSHCGKVYLGLTLHFPTSGWNKTLATFFTKKCRTIKIIRHFILKQIKYKLKAASGKKAAARYLKKYYNTLRFRLHAREKLQTPDNFQTNKNFLLQIILMRLIEFSYCPLLVQAYLLLFYFVER